MKKKILIVVDVQNSFCDPKGELYVAGSEKIFDGINALLDGDEFFLKILTQDWHPRGHVSFASTHGAKPFTLKETSQGIGSPEGAKIIGQTMWPDHCVEGTWGAEIHPAIHADKADLIYRKGRDPTRESYSAFTYVHEGKGTPADDSVFGDMMKSVSCDAVYVCGVALDFCVSNTAIDAVNLFKSVYVIAEATRAVDEKNRDACLDQLKKNYVNVLNFPGFIKNESSKRR
jgi:nicotinamidase/pyrazinamidase